MCTNTNGSYECSCYPGFNKNGAVCDDIDECAAKDNAGCAQVSHVIDTKGFALIWCGSLLAFTLKFKMRILP